MTTTDNENREPPFTEAELAEMWPFDDPWPFNDDDGVEDAEELDMLRSFERGEWRPVPNHEELGEWRPVPNHEELGEWRPVPNHEELGEWRPVPNHEELMERARAAARATIATWSEEQLAEVERRAVERAANGGKRDRAQSPLAGIAGNGDNLP